MFSRYKLSKFVFLGLVLMSFCIYTNVRSQEGTLDVSSDVGVTKVYSVGDRVTAIFYILIDGEAVSGVKLIIQYSGLTDVTIRNGGVSNALGVVIVTGTITGEPKPYIRGEWVEQGKVAQVNFQVSNPLEDISGIATPFIVVNSPQPKYPLSVGDTFVQRITIENHDIDFATLPLSALQMEIVYDPVILELLDVSTGDFLESNGDEVLHAINRSSGKINVSQIILGEFSYGIILEPRYLGELLTLQFRVINVGEAPLGIHKVKLMSSVDNDANGLPDRISYKIIINDVFVTTHQVQYLKEDVNRDGKVDILDIVRVAAYLGTTITSSEPDINKDGIVDISDALHITLSPHWLQSTPTQIDEDINQDGKVDILDIMQVIGNLGNRRSLIRQVDINEDGAVNILDISMVRNSPYWGVNAGPPEVYEISNPNAAAPSTHIANLTQETIQELIKLAEINNDSSHLYVVAISNLKSLIESTIPTETQLLANYPNPFNPETWIPYQLAEATDVTVTIHAINGSLIRRLSLGHQAAGMYRSKNRAAYWDGRNAFGEPVASGLYFYTLTAGNYRATHKMLIRK